HIAEYRERLQGSALELHFACRSSFDVQQCALWHAVIIPDVEPEVSEHAVVEDDSAARDESGRGIVDRERCAAGTGVSVTADADDNIVKVHRNVGQVRAGSERPADASAGSVSRPSDR